MSPDKNPVVVNYSSKSYGSLLFRSPNSPPPSLSPLPPPSMAYLSHLFFSSSLQDRSPSSSLLPLPQHKLPPLLSLPSSEARSLRRTQTKQKAKKKNEAVTKKATPTEERRVKSLMSPPPSSLPLPKFSLIRPKKDASAGGSGGGDGGAQGLALQRQRRAAVVQMIMS